jgi:hypothetical protein
LKDEPKPSFNQVPLFVSDTLTSDRGDLRVAHFFALHAMQILPVMAMLFFWLTPNMSPNTSKQFIWLLAVCYAGFCIYTLMQALSGTPFLGSV